MKNHRTNKRWNDEDIVYLFTLMKALREQGHSNSSSYKIISENYIRVSPSALLGAYTRFRKVERYRLILETDTSTAETDLMEAIAIAQKADALSTQEIEERDRVIERLREEIDSLNLFIKVITGQNQEYAKNEKILRNTIREEQQRRQAAEMMLLQMEERIRHYAAEVRSLKNELLDFHEKRAEYEAIVSTFRQLRSMVDKELGENRSQRFKMERNGNLTRI